MRVQAEPLTAEGVLSHRAMFQSMAGHPCVLGDQAPRPVSMGPGNQHRMSEGLGRGAGCGRDSG